MKNSIQASVDIPVLIVSQKSKTYQPRFTDYVINWGCSKPWEFVTVDDVYGRKIANMHSVNKLETFKAIEWYNSNFPHDLIHIPNWTTDKSVALDWKKSFLARMTLTGHSGQGIVLYDGTESTCVDAPLYVQYKKKKHEYRVHVFKGEVIDVTQKKKRKDADFLDTKIRNHANGWVYCREGINVTDELVRTAKSTISALGLSFGAVDIIWNKHEDRYFVLECNTAPGLVGQTLQAYTQKIVQEIEKCKQ